MSLVDEGTGAGSANWAVNVPVVVVAELVVVLDDAAHL
jgi:hypothetical protein